MERRRFEDSFKDAFQDAQVSPSESVWTSIELDLERAEGGKMKRRILFYKMLAAASVVFGMSVAGVGYYMTQNQTANVNNQTAQVKNLPANEGAPESKSEDDDDAATVKINDLANAGNSVAGVEESEITAHYSDPKPSESSSFTSAGDPAVTVNPKTKFTAAPGKEFIARNKTHDNSSLGINTAEVSSTHTVNSGGDGQVSDRVIPQTSIASTNTQAVGAGPVKKLPARVKPETHFISPNESVVVDPVQLLLANAARRERELADENDNKNKKEEKNNERLWTSVGVAAGAFSSTNTSVSPSISAINATANEQIKAPGVSYSLGVSVGTRLSNRWVLQGGLNYQTQSSDYTANSVWGTSDFQNFYASSMNSAIAKEDTKILNTAPYSVNNSLQFVNVPVQAGYLVVNRKIGVQLNAGISTDLFLQNTITPESGNLEKATQGAGDSSPYRTVNFSGLVGTELTYKFGEHYRLALNPGLRYPMNSIYKSSAGVEAAPLTFDVGLRFRYIFNQ